MDTLHILKSERRHKILEWLSPATFNAKHDELRKTRIINSGQWFVESEPFKQWMLGSGRPNLVAEGIRAVLLRLHSDNSGSWQISAHVSVHFTVK